MSPENLGLFSSEELGAKGKRAPEESLTAPPGTAEKLAMPLPRDDGVPARRRLETLQKAAGYWVERSKRLNARRGQVDAPLEVSVNPADERTYWERVDALTEANPMMQLLRRVPETPPQGKQWTDATSPETER